MLFIHNDAVEKLLSMRECMDAMEEAFRQIPSGRAIHRPRLDMYVPCEREDGYYRWGTMEGANDGIFAIRMKSDVITWPRDASGARRENKYCVRPGLYCGLIMLFSTGNGEPLATRAFNFPRWADWCIARRSKRASDGNCRRNGSSRMCAIEARSGHRGSRGNPYAAQGLRKA